MSNLKVKKCFLFLQFLNAHNSLKNVNPNSPLLFFSTLSLISCVLTLMLKIAY